MNADDVEAAVRAGGFIEHALEGGPAVIGCRGARLDEFRGDDQPWASQKRRVSSRCDGMDMSPAA